jgi:type I restriction enzyme R subunit
MSLEAANREVYRLLKEGVTVSVPDRSLSGATTSQPTRPPNNVGQVSGYPGPSPRGRGGQTTERLRVVDWEHPENNDFLLVSQFSVTGALYTCRPDLVGFVNGLPWLVIELKKPACRRGRPSTRT